MLCFMFLFYFLLSSNAFNLVSAVLGRAALCMLRRFQVQLSINVSQTTSLRPHPLPTESGLSIRGEQTQKILRRVRKKKKQYPKF